MNYKEIIKEEYIGEYKEQHKIFYAVLNSMMFDISFIEACVELQDDELNSDWITISFLHRNVFENLISKVFRCFFDKGGNNATSLYKYKNNVIGRFAKEEYRKEIIDKVNKISMGCEDFNKRKNELERNLLSIRHGFIAHRLAITNDEAVVDLSEIKLLVKYGQHLFQALSFEPRDFYSFVEGDGYDFSKEDEFVHGLTRHFIKMSFLSSKHITKIECTFKDDCEEFIKERIQVIIDDLNKQTENKF